MVKDAEKDEEINNNNNNKKIMVGFIWSCADLKFLIYSLLLIFFIGSIFQFLPFKSLLSPSDLRSCLSSAISSSSSSTTTTTPSPPSIHSLHQQQKQILNSESVPFIKRAFNPLGSAAYLFIQMGAYRGGPNTFAVVGLASKPIHVFSKPHFTCQWVPHHNRSTAVSAASSYVILPDWGYGRVYTVVVLNCTFSSPLAATPGQLIVTASSGGGDDASRNNEETFVALEEETNATVDGEIFSGPPKYDYLYCGSPLYGNLSPQRVREWIAYHARLFGERAHFVIYDAGGVHQEVMEVLRPWVEIGVVTLEDVRDQERFDGYYHNQFLVVNDCLHKYRFAAKWMFFFDVDEFIYVEPKMTLDRLMDSLSGFTQFTIEQMPMSSKLCLSEDAGKTYR